MPVRRGGMCRKHLYLWARRTCPRGMNIAYMSGSTFFERDREASHDGEGMGMVVLMICMP